jgi:hypothetical protein
MQGYAMVPPGVVYTLHDLVSYRVTKILVWDTAVPHVLWRHGVSCDA